MSKRLNVGEQDNLINWYISGKLGYFFKVTDEFFIASESTIFWKLYIQRQVNASEFEFIRNKLPRNIATWISLPENSTSTRLPNQEHPSCIE